MGRRAARRDGPRGPGGGEPRRRRAAALLPALAGTALLAGACLLACAAAGAPAPRPAAAPGTGPALPDRDAWLERLLVDPERFVAEPAFRDTVMRRLVRPPQPPVSPELRDRLLAELARVRGIGFAESEAIELGLGAVPRAGLERRGPFEAGRLRVAADDGGRLAASVYSLASPYFPAAEAAAFLAAVRRGDPERALLALVDSSLAGELRAVAAEQRVHLLPTFDRDYSPWPRDPMSFARTGTGAVELLARPNLQRGREEDAWFAAELIQNLPEELDRGWGRVRWRVSPVPFHNGQVLLTADAAWVSLHTLEPLILQRLGLARVPVAELATAAGAERYAAAARDATAALSGLYARPVRLVHPLAAPAARELPALFARLGGGAGFDLDSYLTLLPPQGGRPQALVADLTAGSALLDRLDAADRDALRVAYGLGAEGAALAAALQAAQATPRARGLDGYLDLTAGHLAAEGWEVRRLPLLLVPVALLAERGELRHEDFLLGWNNVVVERRGERVRAEGFAARLGPGDEEARRAFAAAGVELALLPPLIRSVVLGGGYRCASNHLRVEPGDPAAQRGAGGA